ncbi:phytanoyl-CoA dioxygenase family protein [Neogemmobacter tilapiae]|uniref:Phytanoyl-CoA dioxygenase n=1 Tax=Neogemmobacter tilapiae TaxID=875041 RepID=A0A918WFR9_9RHOB|nr:phytanoyl-CoA dioxygenase family protein [Gemmobacter tilapiae]GHC47210.1 phytanoyl-CoA dioxygenase [Gemmobacter tilapiae]
MNIQTPTRRPVWLNADSGDFETFRRIVSQTTSAADVPHASDVIRNIPIYDGAKVEAADPQALMQEWANVFAHGAGIVVIRQAMIDHAMIDRASVVFDQIIAEEKAAAKGGGDHFAKPGANDRIWNSLEKHCLADPANFAAYYSCASIALASRAWLGPAYQMTAQVNRVNPGGAAQTPHRDYHLGFMSAARMAQFPAHIHGVSPVLTLQGAVAHCDMPVETGPTLLLPFSQQFYEGYLAFTRPEYQAYFAEHHVQLPLQKGDVLFFNPAVFHGAGTNHTTDRFRLVNLLQVSSAFGRAMESVNRSRMVQALFPVLQAAPANLDAENVIAASAEGYPFPTNLDRNPPIGGLAPKTQADFFRQALAEGWDLDKFRAVLADLDHKNLT